MCVVVCGVVCGLAILALPCVLYIGVSLWLTLLFCLVCVCLIDWCVAVGRLEPPHRHPATGTYALPPLTTPLIFSLSQRTHRHAFLRPSSLLMYARIRLRPAIQGTAVDPPSFLSCVPLGCRGEAVGVGVW